MHLKALTLKGFKSFPDRTRLEFGPGVSVVVGPNGSGKSNVTDAVLWALGEQSPLAVRGQSMQDVIFGGGRGVQARSAAEVELVLDNSDQTVALPVSEISIMRRLDRSGEGEYRLNGARCRLVDVIEVLSDTGLGKEMHSVISQGRVEAIVTSKPRDRRLLIEEAAGLGKHRKRRRRAQLKLERTQENLDRALDIEREARSRLRPLKRQAEAAELHARLERQALEARWELTRDALRAARAELSAAERRSAQAREARTAADAELAAVAVRRERAESALAERSERREALTRRLYGVRSGRERLGLRGEQTVAVAASLERRIERTAAELSALEELRRQDTERAPSGDRLAAIEEELAALDRDHQARLAVELAGLEADRSAAARRAAEHVEAAERCRRALAGADADAEEARRALREAERASEAARREAARVGGELAAVNQYLRSHSATARGASTLGTDLQVASGLELAFAAALGGRLGAALAADRPGAGELLDRSGSEGGRVLVPGRAGGRETSAPVPGARRLLDLLTGEGPARTVAERLLHDAWVVDDLESVPDSFAGIAVTEGGRSWSGALGELRQAVAGGEERLLARRNERDRLVGESERAVQAELAARAAAERAAAVARTAEEARDGAERALREAERERARSAEAERQAAWLIEQRRAAPDQGAGAVRRAELLGEAQAERRQSERAARERGERDARHARLVAILGADRALLPRAQRLGRAMTAALAASEQRLVELQRELEADREEGEGVATELRRCAAEEAAIQGRLRERGEEVTAAEVAAQRLRDGAAELETELAGLAEQLGLAAEAATEALDPEAAQALRARLERLARRREQLGPVNPLAEQEYSEALAHVEELEERRSDLETALRELGSLIRDTDRQIQQTFEQTFSAAARNFEELAGDVFPGGGGRLRLVRERSGPARVLGGESVEGEEEPEAREEDDGLGVEIEITPAGKSAKRLSLLSGGEKSMTALAFLFSVFLARPCPFYILDEVEAALDDHNLDRFLALLRRHSGRAQFIVITHQKKTMEAADGLLGVSMGGDGVSKVVSRRLPREAPRLTPAGEAVTEAAA